MKAERILNIFCSSDGNYDSTSSPLPLHRDSLVGQVDTGIHRGGS